MAALTDLQTAPARLTALMNGDPHLALVTAIAWLDPVTLTDGQLDPLSDDFNYDAEDDLAVGLYICRACFPAVYAGAVQLQWQGANEPHIERYLLEGISAQLTVPIDNLEELRYGPSVEFCGIDLTLLEPDEADAPPFDRLLPHFALFGLDAGRDEPPLVQQTALTTARVLIQSLTARSEVIYHDLSNLLLWMFSLSGNTAVDYTQEAFWENGFDAAEWTAADIALINDINQEARGFIGSAANALDLLDTDTTLRQAFRRNVQAISKAVRKHFQPKGDSDVDAHPNRSGDPDSTAFIRHARWPHRA